MKKILSIWSWAMLLVFCVLTFSCSKNDDNANANFENSLSINNEKVVIINIEVADYNGIDAWLRTSIETDKGYISFDYNWYLDNVKVGDDVTKYISINNQSCSSGTVSAIGNDKNSSDVSFELKNATFAGITYNGKIKIHYKVVAGQVY